MANVKILATVAYPVTVEVEIPEEQVKDVLEGKFDIIEECREKIKEEADKCFETSTISPVITGCDLAALDE